MATSQHSKTFAHLLYAVFVQLLTGANSAKAIQEMVMEHLGMQC